MPRQRRPQTPEGEMTPEQTAVLNLLLRNMNEGQGRKVTQLQIANTERQLGSHDIHEHREKIDSTTRKVRQIIRDLRMEFRFPILSDDEGYWLEYRDQAQRDAYLEREAGTINSQIASLQSRLIAMQEILAPIPDHDDVDPVVPSAQTDYSEYEYEAEMLNFPPYSGRQYGDTDPFDEA